MKWVLNILLTCTALHSAAQRGYWQQEVAYDMVIDFDHNTHQFNGRQVLKYTNNSPESLTKVFYHLYFNAFQPGSSMDIRSQTISDPDPRIGSRIAKLDEREIGYQRIDKITQNGEELQYIVEGTVMTVELKSPLAPGNSTVLEMTFNAQVPIQIRRSGRDNSEGVDYTMTQWYPKLAEYDHDGWHTDPYVCREFHGVFGSFNVQINIDPSYVVGGTGNLKKKSKRSDGKQSWNFRAENVHDFAWAADPDFVHSTLKVPDGPLLNFYRLNDTSLAANWAQLEPKTVELFQIMNAHFGKYPYDQFSVIQAGDGGMEYPMCTMISGTGSLGGLVSVTVHEAIHNWYYGVLASNELKYPWMDEGFTTYAQNFVLDSIWKKHSSNPQIRSYRSYVNYVTKNDEEPLTTHADHYKHNRGYGNAAYSKGCVFLSQLRLIVGDTYFEQAMLRYYDQWKFKHPTPSDFKRVMEKTSGVELDWYFESWIGTTGQIDYGIRSVQKAEDRTLIEIESVGSMHMPIEVVVKTTNGIERFFIPIERMRAAHQHRPNSKPAAPWPWVHATYHLMVKAPLEEIVLVEIDPNNMLADVNRDNNLYPKPLNPSSPSSE